MREVYILTLHCLGTSSFTRIAKYHEIVARCRASLHALQSRFAVRERRGRKLHRQQEENRQGHLISNRVRYCTLAQLSSRPLFTSYFWLGHVFAASSSANANSTLRLVRVNWHVYHNHIILFLSNYLRLKCFMFVSAF